MNNSMITQLHDIRCVGTSMVNCIRCENTSVINTRRYEITTWHHKCETKHKSPF